MEEEENKIYEKMIIKKIVKGNNRDIQETEYWVSKEVLELLEYLIKRLAWGW